MSKDNRQEEIYKDETYGEELATPFIWHKKQKKQKNEGHEIPKDYENDYYRTKVEKQDEIYKMRQRREMYEAKLQKRKEMNDMVRRDLDIEANRDWDEKEMEFLTKQALKRTEIRLQQHRERPIDILSKNIHLKYAIENPTTNLYNGVALGESKKEIESRKEFLELLEIDLDDPFTCIRSFTFDELQQLIKDVEEFLALEQLPDILTFDFNYVIGTDIAYWHAIRQICIFELQMENLRDLCTNHTEAHILTLAHIANLPTSIAQSITLVFEGKSLQRLLQMAKQIRETISLGERYQKIATSYSEKDPTLEKHPGKKIDLQYWKAAMQECQYSLAKRYLYSFYEKLLYRRIIYLQELLDIKTTKLKNTIDTEISTIIHNSKPIISTIVLQNYSENLLENISPSIDTTNIDDDIEEIYKRQEIIKNMLDTTVIIDEDIKPQYITQNDIPKNYKDDIITIEKDKEDIKFLRSIVLQEGIKEIYGPTSSTNTIINTEKIENEIKTTISSDTNYILSPDINTSTISSLYNNDNIKDENFEAFKDEILLPTMIYQWENKYQPRKPAYLNKVKTGYDWNKYNQSHYDKDNPPPKVVQGYQFNIFYNDLIDPTCTPKYWLESSPDNNPNFCIIRFSAGPPYQDIAFKIVQKKWQTSPQRGFRCNFVRGVFSLWFNFNRIWYRR